MQSKKNKETFNLPCMKKYYVDYLVQAYLDFNQKNAKGVLIIDST